MFKGTKQSGGRLVTRALAAAALLSAIGLANAGHARAQAYGGGLPYHASAGAYCGIEAGTGRTVIAYPPKAMSTSVYSSNPQYLENIYWRADLVIYTSSGWQLYATNKPWLQAVANSFKIIDGWYAYGYGWNVRWLSFTNLPRGWYAVRETYQWQDGRSVPEYAQFSWNNSTSTMCNLS